DVAVGMVPAELRGGQILLEQERGDVHCAEAGAEMAGAGAFDRRQRVRTRHVGEQREAIVARNVRQPNAVELAARNEPQLRHGSTSTDGSFPSPDSTSAS